MIVVPFLPCHLKEIKVQSAQNAISPFLSDYGYANKLMLAGEAYTVLERTGEVVLCAGLARCGEDCMRVWAILSESAKKHLVYITRRVKSFLERQTAVRLEADVDKTFSQGVRWLEMLGFKKEGEFFDVLRDGCEYIRYVRIN